MYSPHPSISYAEFRQAARRFKPSTFLPAVAGVAIASGMPPYGEGVLRTSPPWGIAAAARESIIYGNEHRGGRVTHREAQEIIRLIHLESANSAARREANIIQTQLAYEQFPYQESIWEEISRSQALFVDAMDEDHSFEVLCATSFEELLGASIQQAIGSTFLLYVGAMQNGGFYDESWLTQANLKSVVDTWTRDAIVATAQRLTATVDEFRADYASAPTPAVGMERYGYNPLVKTPFVYLPDDRVVAPQPAFILRSVSPGGLYYPGVRKWGTKFTRDLGVLIEHYVGKQLKLISTAVVLPEIVYTEGASEARSVDWIIAFPNLLVLVEVKSARLGIQAKAGEQSLDGELARSVGKAVNQINKTFQHVQDRHPAFADLPHDVPVLGLIVTAEPFYFANSPITRDRLAESMIPTSVASLRELEWLVSMDSSTVATALATVATDPELSMWNFSGALSAIEANTSTGRSGARNPILQAAWDALAWPIDVGPSGHLPDREESV